VTETVLIYSLRTLVPEINGVALTSLQDALGDIEKRTRWAKCHLGGESGKNSSEIGKPGKWQESTLTYGRTWRIRTCIRAAMSRRVLTRI
jgi:hypothetical protein